MKRDMLDPEDTEYALRDIDYARQSGQQINGLYYFEYLAPHGMNYVFFITSKTTLEALKEAERVLRANQDVFDVQAVVVPDEMVADDGRDKPSPSPLEAKILKLRYLMRENLCYKIDGVLVSSYMATAIITIYDAIQNPEVEKMYAEMPIPLMAHIAFEILLQQKEKR